MTMTLLRLLPYLLLVSASSSLHEPVFRSVNDSRIDTRSILGGVNDLIKSAVDPVVSLDLRLQVGACVRLAADFTFAASTPNQEGAAQVSVKKNACICVDANVHAGLLDASAGVDVVAQVQGQSTVSFNGSVAQTIARSIQLPILYPGARALYNLKLDPATACIASSLMLRNSAHFFRPKNQVPAGAIDNYCCGRKCIDGYIEKDGQCVVGCPPGQVRRPNGSCKPDCTANQIECNGECFNKNKFTCASGVPVPKRRRQLTQCGPGLTLCPTPWGTGFECLDTKTDMESCGGCVDPASSAYDSDTGVDCTAISNTNNVSCDRGKCVVHSCQRGFNVNAERTACDAGHRASQYRLSAERHG